MRFGSFFALFICAFVTTSVAACHAQSPTAGPETRCTARCKAQVRDCEANACVRGCRFILDRLVEKEGDKVLACISASQEHDRNACASDRTWAICAVNIGPYADGGPPAPTFKRWEDEDDEGS